MRDCLQLLKKNIAACRDVYFTDLYYCEICTLVCKMIILRNSFYSENLRKWRMLNKITLLVVLSIYLKFFQFVSV